MAPGVRITTKPNGNRERVQRDQSPQPHSANLPYEVHSKGKTLLLRELSSQLCPVEGERSCTTILWEMGADIRGKTEKARKHKLWILEVHLECKPQQECQARVLHLRRDKQQKEAEWKPGRAAIPAPAAAASPLGYTHQGQPGHGPIRHRNEGKAPPTTRILSTLTVKMEMHQGRDLHSL